ncbi:MAG: hypothetical protein FJ030_12025 [Chloroflexi bacterium]|nr:hypothetical protein [Chloroflexota bacterium]
MEDQPDFVALLRLLAEARVKMVVIGGVAMTLRAGSYTTLDLDICFDRSPETIALLCRTLAPYCPTIRGALADVISLLASSEKGEKFSTVFGDIDLMGDVAGIGDYQSVLSYSSAVAIHDFEVWALTVDGLIRAKEAVGREKDRPHLIALRALKELLDEQGGE